MGFSLDRAAAGAGQAIAETGFLAMRNEMEKAREQARMEWQTGENEKSRQLTREESAATRDLTREQGDKSREHATLLADKQISAAAFQGEAARKLQKELAEIHERGASARHGASMGVQLQQLSLQREQFNALQNQVTLMPQADGTVLKLRKDGTPIGLLVDPLTEKPYVGTKDISKAIQLMVGVNEKTIAALSQDMRTAVGDEKEAIRQRIDEVRAQTQQLLGFTQKKPEGGGEPSAEDIAGLKQRASDPKAVEHFEARYGKGTAQRYLSDAGMVDKRVPEGNADPMIYP